jgi:hypothetical protein
LREATGDAVIFLDSDDVLMPDCIETCVQALETHPEAGVVYGDAMFVDSEKNPLCLHSQAMPGPRPSGMVLGELARRNFMTVTSMVRRTCLGENNFQEGMEYAEDYDLWRRLASRHQFHYLDKPLLCYRVHDAMSVCTEFAASLAGQVEVQRRIIEMPEFQQLPRREQAQAFCCYGIKRTMLGETRAPRSYFWRAVCKSPAYLAGYPLLLLSLFGNRPLQYMILKRRKFAGNQLGSQSGPIDLVRTQDAQRGADLPCHASQFESPEERSRPIRATNGQQQELACSKY